MKKKLLFIVNPKAGRNVIKGDMINIIEIFSNAGYEVTVYPTKGRLETEEYVFHNAEKFNLVVCAGGDGTLDNTVGGIMKLERSIKRRIHMGYIPCGTTNDYARSLRMSLDPVKAAKDIVEGDICHFDVGRLEDTFFIYIAAFGAFTDISYSTPQNMKNSLGHAAYVLEALRNLASIKNYHLRVWYDGELVEGDFVFGQITNSLSVGGFKNIGSKQMSFSDGLFETVLIKNPENPIELQRIVNALVMDELDDEMIIYRKASRIVIECDDLLPWTCDGEFGGEYKTTRITNIRKAVSMTLKDKTAYLA